MTPACPSDPIGAAPARTLKWTVWGADAELEFRDGQSDQARPPSKRLAPKKTSIPRFRRIGGEYQPLVPGARQSSTLGCRPSWGTATKRRRRYDRWVKMLRQWRKATAGDTPTSRWDAGLETMDPIDEYPRILASHSARRDTARLSLRARAFAAAFVQLLVLLH